MGTAISRRDLFRLRPRDVASLVRDEYRSGSGRAEAVNPVYIRPPGAIPEPEFLDACTRCTKCVEACPHSVIEPLGVVAGPAGGTPALQPETNPCRWCPSMDCIRACASGALSFGSNAAPLPIARAVLNTETCLNRQGILCDTCVMICPPAAKALTMRNREPVLDPEKCVGCGLCAWHCESQPSSFSILPVIQVSEGDR